MQIKKIVLYEINIAIYILLFLIAFIFTACPAQNDLNDNTGTTPSNGQQAAVTSVTVSPETVIMAPGQTQQFTVVVAGTNNPSQTVTWSVEGGGTGTAISKSGLLTIAAGETASVLTVKAASTVDTSKSGIATVTTGMAINWEVNDLATWVDAYYGITNGGNGQTHIITFSDNVTIPPTATLTNTFGSVEGLTVIMQGSGTISTSGNGRMLMIGNGQTIIVKNLILQGRDNTVSLIDISTGGTFCMDGSAKIIGNNVKSSSDIYAGGVRIAGGAFIMQGGAEVSGNAVSSSGMNREARGGGVFLNGGSFVMKDNARVKDNTASISASVNGAYGGGVYINSGMFTMEGGSISNNTVSGGGYGNSHGGGVYIAMNGTFVMENGMIFENKATGNQSAWGGGVFGNFTMHNGTISGNTVVAINSSSSGVVEARGGGVNGNLVMHDGAISGNTVIAGRTWGNNSDVYGYGGGVYGQLTMNGGVVNGNTVNASNDVNANRATANGGGVYAPWSFSKTGGTIYGNHETIELRNIAIGGRGHAIYYNVLGADNNWRNASARQNDNSNRLDFWLDEIDMTYSAIPSNSLITGFDFTFSEDPGNILASHITFCENVSRGNAVLTGSGTTRTLSPVTVSGNGIITVSILSMYKVETGSKSIFLLPDTPTGVISTPSASTVTLNWNPAFLATGYRVFRSLSASGAYTNIGTATSTSYIDISLSKNITYFYRVTAYNSAGNSEIPAQVSVTTLTDNTQRAIAVSSSKIVVEWPRDTSEEKWMNFYNRSSDSINSFLPIPIYPTHKSTFRIHRNDSFLKEIEIPTRLTTIIGWPPFTLVQDSNLLNHYIIDDSELNPNTTYNYRVDIQFYLDYGILTIPTMREAETVMTGSATTLSGM